MSVLGSLRMRREALARVAERWSAFGRELGAVDAGGRVFVPASKISSVVSIARTLSRALPGYQARAQSIVTVLAQSNRVNRDNVVVLEKTGAVLHIAPENAAVVNEIGGAQVVPALWYRRLWGPTLEQTDPDGRVVHRVDFSIAPLGFGGDRWSGSASAMGKLRWNASASGNGGYPRQWSSAVNAGRLNPNRTAAYRAVLSDVP